MKARKILVTLFLKKKRFLLVIFSAFIVVGFFSRNFISSVNAGSNAWTLYKGNFNAPGRTGELIFDYNGAQLSVSNNGKVAIAGQNVFTYSGNTLGIGDLDSGDGFIDSIVFRTQDKNRITIDGSGALYIQDSADNVRSRRDLGKIGFLAKRPDGRDEPYGFIQGVTEDGNNLGGLKFITRKDPGASQLALYMASNGFIGINTENPQGRFSVSNGSEETFRVNDAGTVYIKQLEGQTAVCAGSDGVLRGCASDVRLKKNINPLNNALAKVLNLRGVEFEWDKDNPVSSSMGEGKQIGVIAQEVEKVIPEVVTTGNVGYKSVSYQNLVPVLIEAIKEQQKEIDALKQEVNELKNE